MTVDAFLTVDEYAAEQLRLFRAWKPTPMEQIIASRVPYNVGDGPDESGVYFLFDGDVLAYVGKSTWIAERLLQHWDGGRRFTSFAFVSCPDQRLTMAERDYIRLACPRDNRLLNWR